MHKESDFRRELKSKVPERLRAAVDIALDMLRDQANGKHDGLLMEHVVQAARVSTEDARLILASIDDRHVNWWNFEGDFVAVTEKVQAQLNSEKK